LITLAVKAGSLDKGLQENQETIAWVNLKLPDGENVAGPLISAVVDFYDDVSERDEANNIVVSPPVSVSADRQINYPKRVHRSNQKNC
jgi:hypothetical protein